MPHSEKDFFIEANAVRGISEADYAETGQLLSAVKAFARSTYQCVYVIDYFREGFFFVSENLSYLCGEPIEKIRETSYSLYLNHVPAEEQNMLLEVNQAGFEFFNRIPVADRLDYSITYDFHVTNGRKRRLIHHKLTPLVLTPDGRIWLALCTMSVSSRKTFGNIVMKRIGSSTFHEYSLTAHRWTERQEVTLSDVERSVLVLSAQGYIMSEIADQLCRSIDSIKSCKRLLFDKLGVSNISEAIAYAANSHLL